jgi:SAM-dependent methyltransferase
MSEATGGADWDGEDYQARIDALGYRGTDVHGEADFVSLFHPASVLDAGCGTGRVAIELDRRGTDVVGVDLDDSMLAVARRRGAGLTWVRSDLGALVLDRVFEVVVMAGNVPLFTPPENRAALVVGCARHVAPQGRLVAGFQLSSEYDTQAYDAHCSQAGMVLVERWATWDRLPFTLDSSYAVSVHVPR